MFQCFLLLHIFQVCEVESKFELILLSRFKSEETLLKQRNNHMFLRKAKDFERLFILSNRHSNTVKPTHDNN